MLRARMPRVAGGRTEYGEILYQGGPSVTARNVSYDNVINAGGNAIFGMQVDGSSATPVLTCRAT